MARYRTIKPELFADEKLTECTVDARFTFVGLLPFVDDMGRRQYHPRRIKSEVFPGDDDITANVVDACVQELAKAGVVELYSVDGKRYLRIPHFLRHQVINRPGHCYVPPSPTEGPDAIQCLCTRCKAKNGMFLQEHSEYSLSNHGVVPEYAPQEGKGREGKGVYRASIDPKSSKELHTHSSEAKKADPTPLPEMSEKDRRTQSAAVDEIARRMLNTLELGDNSLLLQVLTKTIEVIIRARSCTVESGSRMRATSTYHRAINGCRTGVWRLGQSAEGSGVWRAGK